MRHPYRLAGCLLVSLTSLFATAPTKAAADGFTATATLTYVGSVAG